MSTQPAATALRGIPSWHADWSCAKVTPPSALMARSPRVPSAPVPDSTTPTACVFQVAAKAQKNASIAASWRQPAAQVGSARQRQRAVVEAHFGIRRNDVDRGRRRPPACCVAHRRDRQARGLGQDLGQGALVLGIEVRHDHEGVAAIVTQGGEKFGERLQPAGRRAEPNHAEPRFGRFRAASWARRLEPPLGAACRRWRRRCRFRRRSLRVVRFASGFRGVDAPLADFLPWLSFLGSHQPNSPKKSSVNSGESIRRTRRASETG